MAAKIDVADLVVRFSVEMGELKKEFGNAREEMKKSAVETGAQLASIQRSLTGFKAQYLIMAAEITAAYMVVRKAMEWAEIGARAIQTEEAFAAITKSIGVNGDLLIAKMQEVGYVFVESTGLMTKAMRMLVEDVPVEAIVGLMESARVAARIMGTDVESAFNRIADSIVMMRTRGLRAAFGTIEMADITKKYAESMGLSKEYLSDVGKRLALIEEIAKRTTERKILLVGKGGMLEPTVAENIEKFKNAMGELREVFGKLITEGGSLLPVLTDIVKALISGISAAREFKKEFGAVSEVIGVGLKTVLIGVGGLLTGVTAIWLGVLELNRELLTIFDIITFGKIPGLSKALKDFTEHEEKIWNVLQGQAEELNRTIFGGKEPEGKSAAEKAAEEAEKIRKENLVDLQKMIEKADKMQLQADEQRVSTQGKVAMSALQIRKEMELRAARGRGRDTFAIEQEFARMEAELEYKNTAAIIAEKRRQQLDELKLDPRKLEAAGQIEAAKNARRLIGLINQQANDQDREAFEKMKADIAKIDSASTAKMLENLRSLENEWLQLVDPELAARAAFDLWLDSVGYYNENLGPKQKRILETVRGAWEKLHETQGRIALDQAEINRRTSENSERTETALTILNVVYEKGTITIEEYYKQLRKLNDERIRESIAILETKKAQITQDDERAKRVIMASKAIAETAKAQIIASEGAERKAKIDAIDVEIGALRGQQLRDRITDTNDESKALRDQTSSIADWGLRLAEAESNWDGIYNAQIEVLKVQKETDIELAKGKPILVEYINAYYELQIAQAEAYKNLDLLKLAELGMKEYAVTAKREIGDTFKDILPANIRAFGNEFRNMLKTGEFDFKAFGDALTDIWTNVCQKLAEKWITDFLMKLAAPSEAGAGGGGGGWLGGLLSLLNLGGTEAAATSVVSTGALGEFAMALAWQHGGSFWAKKPTPMIVGEGGEPEFVSVTPKSKMGESRGSGGAITIINVVDAREMDQYLASSRGQDAVLNILSSRSTAVRRVLR